MVPFVFSLQTSAGQVINLHSKAWSQKQKILPSYSAQHLEISGMHVHSLIGFEVAKSLKELDKW